MVLGIGIDTVDIARFADWHKKSSEQLQKMLSIEEINYCLNTTPEVSAERFAVRFAAREAFFKAYQATLHRLQAEGSSSLLSVNKQIAIQRVDNGLPLLQINWNILLAQHAAPTTHLSLTHTPQTATAMVVIEQSN